MQILSNIVVGLTASTSASTKPMCRSVVRVTIKLSAGIGSGVDDLQSLEISLDKINEHGSTFVVIRL